MFSGCEMACYFLIFVAEKITLDMKDDFQENIESSAFLADQPLSDYETERDKPMPNMTHGAIQANLIFELKTLLGMRFRFASEVTLNTKPSASTPDILLSPPEKLDFLHAPSKRTAPVEAVIEILSNSQSISLAVEKAIAYFEFGVKSCWIVLPPIKAILVFNTPGHPDIYRFFNENAEIVDEALDIRLPIEKVFA